MINIETIIKLFASIIAFISMPSINIHDINIKVNEELYKDNKYFYIGKNPNNYIVFNNELWRILAFENDGTIKIIKNESLGNMLFDKKGTNNWNDSYLKEYLNKTYYNSLNSEAKSFIIKHGFNVGSVYKNNKSGHLKITKMEEKEKKWYGYIGLMTISDFLEVSFKKCPSIDYYLENYEMCNQNNYISSILQNEAGWTLSKDSDSNNIFYAGMPYFPDVNTYENKLKVLPVIYLNKNVKLEGNGTMENPYMIKGSF